MAKFFQKRGVAITVLALAVLLSSVWGFLKRPASLPDVRSGVWVFDKSGLLSSSTKTMIETRDSQWDSSFHALCAVAAVQSIRGWDANDYTLSLGDAWGLGANDLLLVLEVENQNWHFNGGTDIINRLTDAEINRIYAALETPVAKADWDGAVSALFPVVDDIFSAHYAAPSSYSGYDEMGYDGGWESSGSVSSIAGSFLLLLIVVLVLWILIDRARYNRYRRRATTAGAPPIVYQPIFWGRPSHIYAPPRPPHTHNPPPPSGGMRPPRPPMSGRPSGSSFHGSGFSGGGRGGFSGGSRGGFSGGGRGGFSGGGRGGFSGGSRGGFSGGRR